MKKIVLAVVLLIIVAVIYGSQKPQVAVTDLKNEVAVEPEKVVFVVPSQPLPILAQPSKKFSASTVAKLKILDEIFAAKNDNDPRLDTEFNDINPEMRAALVVSYKALPKERLNERGTLVFLLGKELSSEKDLDFFQELLAEAPCLSLSDCSVASKLENPADDHLSESQETTLVYPQLVAMRLISANYQETKNATLKEGIVEFFKIAEQSSSEYLSQEATRISSEAGIKPEL